jgi:dTDP-4-amino-4,6-dideoxygalactose transaminase
MSSTTTPRIYLSPPDLDGREAELLLSALRSNWITTLGPEVERFEREMSEVLKVPYALAVSSGTAAIHLALVALGVGHGDTVLCSDLTFAASAFPIMYCGARPVFVDCDRATWTMDPDRLDQAFSDLTNAGIRPKAVIVVDLYGQSANHRLLADICSRYGVPIIEDAAEALGATYEGTPCGGFGEMGVLSFNGNKIITTSGGGMLVSRKAFYLDQARHLAAQARDPFPYYQHSRLGYNYRMSNLLAAIGRAQLERLSQKLARRKEIRMLYEEALRDIPGITFMPPASYGNPSWWLTCITVDPSAFGATNEQIRLRLEKDNIESRHVWKPMHLQPVFAGCPIYGGQVSESLFTQGLCLPSGSSLKNSDVERIYALIRGFHIEQTGRGSRQLRKVQESPSETTVVDRIAGK